MMGLDVRNVWPPLMMGQRSIVLRWTLEGIVKGAVVGTVEKRLTPVKPNQLEADGGGMRTQCLIHVDPRKEASEANYVITYRLTVALNCRGWGGGRAHRCWVGVN